MVTYDEALKAGDKAGAAHATEVQHLARFCRGVLPYVAGAVSPRLVFESAQAAGLTTKQLARLAEKFPLAVAELQWPPEERHAALAAEIRALGES
jgi:hypothetical protein